MSKLMRRVKSHTRGQMTSGQNTLVLFVECVEHMFGASGDWSPLAWLIGQSQEAQGRECRRLAGQIIQGYSVKADASQPSGLRFVKKNKFNYGFDENNLNKVRALVDEGKSIQSADVKALFKQPSAIKTLDELLQSGAGNLVRRMHKEGIAFSAIVAAVQTAATEAQAKEAAA